MTGQNEFESTQTDSQDTDGNSPAPRESQEQLLYSKDSLCAFKTNQAWPGRNYYLVGQSHTIDRRTLDAIGSARRAACIDHLLQRGRNNQHCVTIKEALTVPGFVSCLSSVEYAWLKKQPQATLVGPSYDSDGTRIAESFAVWCREDVCKSAGRAHGGFRSFRTLRNNAGSRHEMI